MTRLPRILILAVLACLAIASPAYAALIANVAAGSTNTNNVTTGAVDTSGATFLVAAVSGDQSAAAPAVTDSKTNTWTALTRTCTTSNVCVQLVYVANPTVGASHTFTATQTGAAMAIAVGAFSAITTTTPFDVQNGAFSNTAVTTLATGSVTPSENGELIIAGNGRNGEGSSVTIDASLTITDSVATVGGQHYGVSLAYYTQPTAAAINPAYSWTTAVSASARIATFKAAAAAGGPPVGSRMLLGVGR